MKQSSWELFQQNWMCVNRNGDVVYMKLTKINSFGANKNIQTSLAMQSENKYINRPYKMKIYRH